MSVFREMAADKLCEDGWIQGDLFRRGEGYSLRGAINAVTSSNPHMATITTRRVVDELEAELGMSLDEWNDAEERTVTDCLLLLVTERHPESV